MNTEKAAYTFITKTKPTYLNYIQICRDLLLGFAFHFLVPGNYPRLKKWAGKDHQKPMKMSGTQTTSDGFLPNSLSGKSKERSSSPFLYNRFQNLTDFIFSNRATKHYSEPFTIHG